MRKTLLLLTTFFSASLLFAQKNGTIRGIAFDTISKSPVAGATVSLLERKDSSLVSFTMTNADGKFELRNLAGGDYRIMITHVTYHNSNKLVSLSDNNKNIELGNIVMS